MKTRLADDANIIFDDDNRANMRRLKSAKRLMNQQEIKRRKPARAI